MLIILNLTFLKSNFLDKEEKLHRTFSHAMRIVNINKSTRLGTVLIGSNKKEVFPYIEETRYQAESGWNEYREVALERCPERFYDRHDGRTWSIGPTL